MAIEEVIPIKIPQAKVKKMMVAGNATIYRTLLVKLKSRNRFPTKPQTKEAMFKAKHLRQSQGCTLPKVTRKTC